MEKYFPSPLLRIPRLSEIFPGFTYSMLLAPSCGRILTSILQSTRLGVNHLSFAHPSVQWKLKVLVSLVYKFWLPFCACSLTTCQSLLLPSLGRSTHRELATGCGGCAREARRGLMVPVCQLREPMGKTFPAADWWAS